MRVEAPNGTWYVRRRWAPRHLGKETIGDRFRKRSKKVRERSGDLADIPDPGCAGDIGEAIGVFVILVVVIVFLVFFGIPFLIALGELLLIVLLAVLGALAKVLFRRPWTVDAVSPDGDHHTWSVVGWGASATARQFVADRLAATGSVPSPEEVAAATLAG